MAESPEHEFLKTRALEVLQDFSRLKLYGFSETDRKRFDFSCVLERDWSRPLAGQVLWRHSDGIDKDVRTLLTDGDSEIKVYVAGDSIAHRRLFEEVVTDYRTSGRFHDLFRLKAIWVPQDFDADREQHRRMVSQIITAQIVEDILFNVILNRISADDLALFLTASGIPGLNLAILHLIATEGFVNISTLAQRLDVSPGPIREKLPLLAGCGFISSPLGVAWWEDTSKGRVFLDIVSRVFVEFKDLALSGELSFVLAKLGCDPVSRVEVDMDPQIFPSKRFVGLVRTIRAATRWGIDFAGIDYTKKAVKRPPGGPETA